MNCVSETSAGLPRFTVVGPKLRDPTQTFDS